MTAASSASVKFRSGGLQAGFQILERRPLTPSRHRLRVNSQFLLSVENEACDRYIAALTACEVVALP